MCNNLKNGNRVYKIPEYGFGYKVFLKSKGNIKTLRTAYHETKMLKNAWIEWEDDRYTGWGHGDGFCFFLTLQDMKDFYVCSYETVRRIRYRKGLGRRREGDSYMSSLCKEFKILKEVDIKDLK